MFRLPASPLLAALLTVAIATPAGLRAQLSEGILSPAGRLRLEVSPTFDLWANRYGTRVENGTTVDAVEPLGFDVERFPIPTDALQQALRTALGSPSTTLS